MDLQHWDSVASISAALIAIGAIFQARHIQNVASSPYIGVFAEPSPSHPEVIDLVIKNFGPTAARNVRVSFRPTLQRAPWDRESGPVDVETPGCIPTMAPGQEWRTTWDISLARAEKDMPDEYAAEVCWKGRWKKCEIRHYTLAWRPHFDRRFTTVKTADPVVEALTSIQTLLENAHPQPEVDPDTPRPTLPRAEVMFPEGEMKEEHRRAASRSRGRPSR